MRDVSQKHSDTAFKKEIKKANGAPGTKFGIFQ
jgi:hypothetical protein